MTVGGHFGLGIAASNIRLAAAKKRNVTFSFSLPLFTGSDEQKNFNERSDFISPSFKGTHKETLFKAICVSS